MRLMFPLLLLPLAVSLTAGCGSSKPSGVSYESKIADAMAKPNPDGRAFELIKIGYQQGKKGGDSLGSTKTLEAADAACAEIGEPAIKSARYTMLADAHFRLGNRLDAGKALKEAKASAEAVEGNEGKSGAIAAVAAIYAEMKNDSEATALYTTAEDLAGKIEDSQTRALALKDVGKSLIKGKQIPAAEKTLAKAVEVANSLEDAKKRSDALAQVAAVQMGLDDKSIGEATLESALAEARKVEAPYAKVDALNDIAELLIENKQPALAEPLLVEIEKLIKTISEVDLQGQAEERRIKTKAKLGVGK